MKRHDLGFNRSILEVAIAKVPAFFCSIPNTGCDKQLQDSAAIIFIMIFCKPQPFTKYRNSYLFIDTAGSGYNEEHGADGTSLQNEGELEIVQKIIETESLEAD